MAIIKTADATALKNSERYMREQGIGQAYSWLSLLSMQLLLHRISHFEIGRNVLRPQRCRIARAQLIPTRIPQSSTSSAVAR